MPSTTPHITKTATCLGHQDCIYAVAGTVGQRVFHTAGADGMVVQWSLDSPDSGEVVAKVEGTVYAMCPIPGGDQLIVGQNFEGIHLIDLERRERTRSLRLTDSAIFDIRLFDGHLFVACGDGSIKVIDLGSWQRIATLTPTDKAARTLTISPERGEFAVGFSDHLIRVFGLNDLALRHTLKGHTNSVFALAYTPDAALLMSAGRDAHLRTWDTADGYALRDDIIPHMYTVNDILFRPDGRVFATCSKDKSIRIWDAVGLRPLKTIDRTSHAGHGTSVNRLLWMDDRTLISVSDDRSVSIWDIGFDL